MFCEKCGSPIGPNEKFCKNCGQAIIPSSINNNVQANYSGMNMMNNGGNSMGNGMNPNPNYNNSMNNMNQQNVYTPNNSSMNSFPSNNMPMNSYMPSGNKTSLSKGAVAAIIGIFVVAIAVAFCLIALPKIMNKGDNSESSSTADAGNKVSYQNFTLSIPSSLKNGYEDGYLYIYNNQWASYIDIAAVDFSQIKSNILLIKANIQQEGYTVDKTDVSTYNGVEFVNFYISKDGDTAVFAYAKLNSEYCICYTIVDSTLTFGSDIFNTLATITKNAKYNPSTMGMKASTTSIDHTKTFELVK